MKVAYARGVQWGSRRKLGARIKMTCLGLGLYTEDEHPGQMEKMEKLWKLMDRTPCSGEKGFWRERVHCF